MVKIDPLIEFIFPKSQKQHDAYPTNAIEHTCNFVNECYFSPQSTKISKEKHWR